MTSPDEPVESSLSQWLSKRTKDYDKHKFVRPIARKLINSKLLPQGSIRMFILAPTESGKSSFVCEEFIDMISLPSGPVGGIYVRYSLTANQDAYISLNAYARERDIPITQFKTLTQEFIDSLSDDNHPKFVLIDDINENFSRNERLLISPLFFEGRKANIYCIASGQSYKSLTESVKANCNVICIYPMQTGTIHYFKGIITGFISKKAFEKAYHQCEGKRFWFLMLIRNMPNYIVDPDYNFHEILEDHIPDDR